MRKGMITLALLAMLSIGAKAQYAETEEGSAETSNKTAHHEIKMNALSSLLGRVSLGYEYAQNSNIGLSIWTTMYNPKTSLIDGDNESGFQVIPEVRFYFPKATGTDRFFTGAYLKHARSKTKDNYALPSSGSQPWETINYSDVEVKNSATALGLLLGKKWSTDYGFMFETTFGIGRNIHRNTSTSVPAVENHLLEDGRNLTIPPVDARLGITLGWRFGG